MSFTADALKLIQDTARKSADPKPLSIPDPRAAHFVIDGELRTIAVPPADRKHCVTRLSDLVAIAQRSPTPAAIWHNDCEVVCLLDTEDRRERVTLPLEKTAIFTLVQVFQSGQWFDQPKLVRLLRVDLAEAVSPDVLRILRTVRFRRGEETISDQQKDQESLGKKIEQHVSGAEDLPETIPVSGQIYRNREINAPFDIVCALEVDFAQHKFRLSPLADSVADALQDARQIIDDLIRSQLNAPRIAGPGRDAEPDGPRPIVHVYEGTP